MLPSTIDTTISRVLFPVFHTKHRNLGTLLLRLVCQQYSQQCNKVYNLIERVLNKVSEVYFTFTNKYYILK